MALLVSGAPAGGRDTADELRPWIEEHRVCFELSPRFEMHGQRKIQVGFDLTLFARPPEAIRDDPGGDAALAVHQRLQEIALRVLPGGIHPSRCAFVPFDASFHLRPETRWAPEIQLELEIVHRDSTFGDVDEDERRYAEAMQEGLRRLGARHRTWLIDKGFHAGR